jgi:hypothetical protein
MLPRRLWRLVGDHHGGTVNPRLATGSADVVPTPPPPPPPGPPGHACCASSARGKGLTQCLSAYGRGAQSNVLDRDRAVRPGTRAARAGVRPGSAQHDLGGPTALAGPPRGRPGPRAWLDRVLANWSRETRQPGPEIDLSAGDLQGPRPQLSDAQAPVRRRRPLTSKPTQGVSDPSALRLNCPSAFRRSPGCCRSPALTRISIMVLRAGSRPSSSPGVLGSSLRPGRP